MASKKPIFDRDRAFKSIVGIEENVPEEKKEQPEEQKPEATQKPSPPQALEAKIKVEKPTKKETTHHTPKEIKEKKEAKEIKETRVILPPAPPKPGRKILNREKRSRYSFTILPSIYKHAQDKALKKGESLSEVISNFLKDYAK